MSVQVQGETVTADNLESVLRRCADNIPGDNKPDSQSWGASAAAELLQGIKGTPLEAQANSILEKFLASGSADEVRLAETFCDPALIDPRVLTAALQRTDLEPSVIRKVRAALGRALGAQPKKYDPSIRALLGQPGSDSLIGAVIIADHDWFLQHLPSVLGTNPDAAANRFWYGVTDLNADEARTLRAELDTRRGVLGAPLADALIATIDGEAATFTGRNAPRRW